METQAETLKEMLLSEAYLDIDVLVALNPAETEKYLASLKGFNTENIELLAKTLTELSINGDSADSRTMLEKALQLYEICNLRDRTFSFEREAAVNQIQEVLQK